MLLVSLVDHTASAQTTVTFLKSDRYTDAGAYGEERKQTMAEIERHLKALGERHLTPGQALKIEVLDIDLAGRMRYGGRDLKGVRVVDGRADPPAIKLRYTLESGGKVVDKHEERVSDPNYFEAPRAPSSAGNLFYEKRMLDEWFRARFAKGAAPLAGALRLWGHGSRDADFIGPLVKSWEKGLKRHQPAIEIIADLKGNKSAIGGLYTGAADAAIMERELSAIERDGYEQLFGRTDPFAVTVATGSLDKRHHAMALAIFVNESNPLSRLTLAQLDAIAGTDHRRGPKNIRTWGDLGLGGDWASCTIRVYGFAIDEDPSQYFQKAVMGGSQKWTGNLQELGDLRKADGSVVEAGQRIAEAVAGDRCGIGISTMAYRVSQVKPLALAAEEGGTYYEPTRETVAQRTYPLTRTVSVYVNREPGKPLEAKARAFLGYVLSREGQDDVARDAGYLPLPPEIAVSERKRLE